MILHGKNGPVELSPETVQALTKAWPTKDVPTELAKMHLWLLAHESRRPVYFWTFVKNWMRKAPDVIRPEPKIAAWWATEQRTLNQGAALGLSPRPGESIAEYRERISEKMRGAA